MDRRRVRLLAALACGAALTVTSSCVAGETGRDSDRASPEPDASRSAPLPGDAGELAPRAAASEAEAQERAEQAADALARALITRLTSGIEAEGTVGALGICARVAQDLTREASEVQGVEMRRTALRVRNPANAPDAYERAWLEGAERRIAETGERPAATSEAVARDGAGRELRYVRPLYLAALCVQCHGVEDRLAEGVPEALATLYPDDRATGFEPGDLRGVISVRVPLPG